MLCRANINMALFFFFFVQSYSHSAYLDYGGDLFPVCRPAPVREAPKSPPTPSPKRIRRTKETKVKKRVHSSSQNRSSSSQNRSSSSENRSSSSENRSSSSLGLGGPAPLSCCRNKFGAVPPVLGGRIDGVGGESVTRSTRRCSSPVGVGGRCSINKFSESAGSYAHDPRVEERAHTSQKPEAKVDGALGVPAHSLGRLVWLSKVCVRQ